jgi:small basic protein
VRFQAPILGLIVVVGLARFALSVAGLPNSAVKWLSIFGVLFVGTAYCGVRAATTGFGTYRHLLPPVFIQSVFGNLIIILAIVYAIATGHDNIYTAPEYSGNADGKNWGHVLGHVVVGAVMFPLLTWILACGVYLVTRKLAPSRAAAAPIV